MVISKSTVKVLKQYSVVDSADTMARRVAPVIETILKHDRNERLTVQSIGEEIMGKDAYHEKYAYPWGGDAPYRTNEARTITGTITQALVKLCRMGAMTRHEETDMDRTIEIKTQGYRYLDSNNNEVPEYVEITLANGQKSEIRADNIRGVHRVYGEVTKKIHPKISYYTFN